VVGSGSFMSSEMVTEMSIIFIIVIYFLKKCNYLAVTRPSGRGMFKQTLICRI
jgi:hypothetical protein